MAAQLRYRGQSLCVYLAPDANSIREHARRVGLPADCVAEVRRLIDPAKLK